MATAQITQVEQDKADWLQHPQTVDLLRRLHQSITEAEADWSSEQFARTDLYEGALANAYALGGVNTLKDIIKTLESKDGK
jgi:hypothetical protein